MKIVIAGGTGFIGRALCRALVKAGHQITVLSRDPAAARASLDPSVAVAEWDGRTLGTWEPSLDGAGALINLAGEPIADARWTAARKQVLFDSRVGATRVLVEALRRSATRPRILINASGIGYYGPRRAEPVDESTPAGSGFLAELCRAWEQEAQQAESFGARVVRMRFGMVLEKDGGALARMVLPFRLFVGGPISPGTQWVSWIHREDLIGLMEWALATPSISGPVNAVSLQAATMREFCRKLGEALHRPSWLPVPGLALRLGLGEMADMLTTGQRVQPAVANRHGYVFQYPELGPALRAIWI